MIAKTTASQLIFAAQPLFLVVQTTVEYIVLGLRRLKLFLLHSLIQTNSNGIPAASFRPMAMHQDDEYENSFEENEFEEDSGFELIDEDELENDDTSFEEDEIFEDEEEDEELDFEEENFFREDEIAEEELEDEDEEDDNFRESIQDFFDENTIDSDEDYYYGEYEE